MMRITMDRIFRVATALVMAGAMTGCANTPLMSNSTTATTAGGAGLGAIAGAVIGNQVGSPLEGAAVGAGLGGLAGYGVARSSQPSANSTQCPPGYNCTPAAPPPPPPCPPGYSCAPAN